MIRYGDTQVSTKVDEKLRYSRHNSQSIRLHNVGKEEVKAPVGSQSESSQNRRRSFVNFPKSTRPTSEVNSQISTPSTGNSEGSILSARKIADISHSPGNIASNTSNPENSLSITSSPQNSASTITLPVNSVKSTSYLENSSGRKQSLDDSSATKVLLKNSDSKSAGKSSVSTFLVENSLKKSSENVYSSKVSQQNLTSYNLSQKNSQSSTISPENSSSKHSPKTVVDTKKTSTNSNIKDTSSSRLSPANSASTTTSTTANARSKLSGDSQQRKFSGSSSPSGDSEAPIVIARAKDIIPRKIFKDGEWYEQKEEQIFKYKSNGKVFHKVKISETPYNASEETLSDLEEIESNPSSGKSSTKTFAKFLSRHGRSLIQDDQEVFCKEVVEKINSYRQMHAVRHVKLSQSLCLLARERAKYFAYSSKINFSNRYDIGESIFIKELLEPFKKISGEDIVEKWYSEIELHNFENYSNIIAVNFTQMVWQATKEVGAAIERSPDGQIAYAVACYYPKGNFPGEHVKQVAPVGGFAYRPRNEKGIIQPNVAVKTDNFVKGVMRAMNYYRLQHGTISLLLDKTLTEYAQEWADQLAQEDQIRSRPSNIYGENIYRSSVRTSINISGQEPVKYWYRKKRFYNFSKPGDIRAAPFTQLVWQDCREVGLGMARSTSDHIYVVANFNPPGNMVGQFEEQVGHLQWR